MFLKSFLIATLLALSDSQDRIEDVAFVNVGSFSKQPKGLVNPKNNFYFLKLERTDI